MTRRAPHDSNDIFVEAVCIPTFGADWFNTPHRHDEFCEMVFLLEGELITEINGQTLRCGPGSAIFHPKGMYHAEKACGAKVRMIVARWSMDETAGLADLPLHAQDRNGKIQTGLQWMANAFFIYGPDVGESALSGILQAVLHEYRHADRAHEDEIICSVRIYVHDHLAEHIALDDLANAACVSRYHFARIFRRAAGYSPIEYVNRVRVEAARQMILSTSLPIGVIASSVGFEDKLYFSRVYRKIYGFPPSHDRHFANTSP